MADPGHASQQRSGSSSGEGRGDREEGQDSTGHHRVKFSLGADDAMQEPQDAPRKPLPQPRKPCHVPRMIDSDSTDLTDLSSTALGTDSNSGDADFSPRSTEEKARGNNSASSSAPISRLNSFEDSTEPLLPSRGSHGYPVRMDDIPLSKMKGDVDRSPYSTYDDTTDEDEEDPQILVGKKQGRERKRAGHKEQKPSPKIDAEAHRLVRAMTNRLNLERAPAPHGDRGELRSGRTRTRDGGDSRADVPEPDAFKPGILSMLLKLSGHHDAAAAVDRSYHKIPRQGGNQDEHSRRARSPQPSSSTTPGTVSLSSGDNTPDASGTNTPRRAKWYQKPSGAASTPSLVGLLDASIMMGSPAVGDKAAASRSHLPYTPSAAALSSATMKLGPRRVNPDDLLITVHIAEVLSRQRYLLTLCRALMTYGAPTHRLEEYMRTSARVLQIEGQFLYIPGCMIVSLDDSDLHTTEVRIVKSAQGLDLGKFRDTFEIYKEVAHDVIGVEEAIQRLDEVTKRPDKFNVWIKILMYGCASAFVGPFAFGARPIDMPIAFVLGCVLGVLQLWVAPKSEMYSNVFEITASIITSLAARGLGSITRNGTPIFCFSALAQSSIALILPGYIILCGSLELGTRNLVAGSVRLVYAIIYALMLGFGITIGTASYGLMDKNATSVVTCADPESLDWWNNHVVISRFPWVPLFTLCLVIINQAEWKQAPVMVLISFVGYQVNFWSAKRFANNVQIANALGAFAIGVMGNLYSRLRHGLAAAAIIPAIFVQVPSGLAASGSLVSGLTSADQITGNATGVSVISNGTQGFADAQNGTTRSGDTNVYSGTVFNVGYGMVQVAIGISVGLFLSALIVYPFGKKRSGLFSF